jgi:hypothetical protein
MKTFYCVASIGGLLLSSLIVAVAGDNTNSPSAIGVYDSRAVAYAHFWSAPRQKNLQEQMALARDAKTAGNTAKFEEYRSAIRAGQDQIHREVFSTAPADEAMAAIKDRIPEIEKQVGVTALVSKWDGKTLQTYKDVRCVDMTDQLVRQFIQPTEQQSKVISSMEKSEPLSPEKCEELIRKGEI